MNWRPYLPWIVLGGLTWVFCPYFKGEEVTSGEKSLEAVDDVIRRMG